MAAQILSEVDAVAVWKKLILQQEKPQVVASVMKYLTDRVYGSPVQTIQGNPEQPVTIQLQWSSTREIMDLFDRLMESFGIATGAVHHDAKAIEGKDDGQLARGSTIFGDWVDSQLVLRGTSESVILGRADEEEWLDPEVQEQSVLQRMFNPCPSEWLTAVEVSPLVNSAKNNSPEVLQPAGAERGRPNAATSSL